MTFLKLFYSHARKEDIEQCRKEKPFLMAPTLLGIRGRFTPKLDNSVPILIDLCAITHDDARRTIFSWVVATVIFATLQIW